MTAREKQRLPDALCDMQSGPRRPTDDNRSSTSDWAVDILVFEVDCGEENAYTEALNELPPTFTVRTQDGSNWRYYTASKDTKFDILHATFGAACLDLSWGQLYTKQQCAIRPLPGNRARHESQPQGPEDPKQPFRLSESRMAELSSEQLLDVLVVDPEYQTGVPQSTIDAYKEQGSPDEGIRPYEDDRLWAHSPKVLATQARNRRLLKSIQRIHNHPDNTDGGVLMWDFIDRTEELGVDSTAALRALSADLVEKIALKPA